LGQALVHDILLIVLGWAIPLFLAWLLAKVPAIRDWIVTHQFATGIALSCLISTLISTTAVIAYDRYFLSPKLDALHASLKSEINAQFDKLPHIDNVGTPFRNTATHTGAGSNPTVPPGRCQPGQMVVGLQPETGGATDFVMQCGAMPTLHLN
jgi:hypothetical protein